LLAAVHPILGVVRAPVGFNIPSPPKATEKPKSRMTKSPQAAIERFFNKSSTSDTSPPATTGAPSTFLGALDLVSAILWKR
jgi:hypothetical protein